MSQSAYLAMMRELQRIHGLLVMQILPDIEKEHAASQGLAVGSMAGRGRDLVNEAQIRKYILDPILKRLGWRLDQSTNIIVEAPAEAHDVDSHRRFLDYHGKESLADGDSTSLLIIEAKRLSVSLPTEADDGPSAAQELRLKITNMHSGQGEQLSAAWKKIVNTLADYVERLSSSSSGAPKRVVLTNGDWYLVFNYPYKTLVDNLLEPDDLTVYVSLEDASKRANEFYRCLSYESLCNQVPPQHSLDLCKFVSSNDDTVDVCLSADVSTACLCNVQPVIGVDIVAHVRIPGAGWVQFRRGDDGLGHVVIDHREEYIEDDMIELENRAKKLIAELNMQAKTREISASEYESDRLEAGVERNWPQSVLVETAGKDRFIVHLGKLRRPLLPDTEYDNCAYHNFGDCHAEGVAVGTQPLLAQSTDPAAYFPSGSPFHCANKTVHSSREERCPIQVLDEFLCCRRCALRDRCWVKGFDKFPCKS